MAVKAKLGVLLFSNAGLRKSGAGTAEGSYEQRISRNADKLLEGLSEIAELTFEGIVYGRVDLDRSMERFVVEKVDAVFALYLSWAPDANWIRFLRDMAPVPVLFACMTPDEIPFNNTFSETDSVAANTVRGLVGSLQASGSIARYDRPMMETVLGTREKILDRTRIFCAAAAVRGKLKNAVFAQMERFHEVMWSTYVAPYQLFMNVGPEMRSLPISTVRREMEKISDEEVAAAAKTVAEKYPIMDDVDRSQLEPSIRASLAVDHLAAAMGAEMVIMNDLDPVLTRELGLRPGFLPCPGGHDIPAIAEGDIGGGVAAYILRLLTGRPANFVEPGYINRQTGFFDVGHGGPADYTDPEGSVKIARDSRFAKADIQYPGAPFAWYVIPPGVKTMLHVSQYGDGFKMACTLVESVPVEHFHASFCHGRCKTLTGEADEVFGKLMEFGVTQHFVLAPGDHRKELECLAKMMNFKFLSV